MNTTEYSSWWDKNKKDFSIRLVPVELAAALGGVLEAMIIIQIDFRLKTSKYQWQGVHWFPCSYGEWHEREFPFAPQITIRRTLERLREAGFIRSGQPFPHGDRRLYWTVNWDKVGQAIQNGQRN